MSLGLLGDYGSDSSDEDSSPTTHNQSPSNTTPHYDPLGITGTQDDSNSSSSSASEVDHTPSPTHQQESTLPLPDLEGPPQSKEKSSVFSNPYLEAEKERLTVLKHHVGEFTPEVKEEKRRGRRGKRRGRGGMALGHMTDDDSKSVLGPRKIRCGVGDTLQPAKKYMKLHTKIQREESPWTHSQHKGL